MPSVPDKPSTAIHHPVAGKAERIRYVTQSPTDPTGMLGKADQNGNLLIGCHPTDRNLFHDAIHILIKKGSIYHAICNCYLILSDVSLSQ